MIKLRILILTLCLLVPASAFAQKASADKSWQSFWTQFSAAVKKKSPAALKRLAAPKANFSNGGGLESPAEWIAIIQKDNLWNEYQSSVAAGTKSFRCETTCRMTKNQHLMFEVIGGRWRWTGLVGD